MNKSGSHISQLFSIRNKYGKKFSSQKLNLLNELDREPIKSKKALKSYYYTLLFLIAYPDNKSIYQLASQSLQHLHSYIQSHENIKLSLFNSGITNTHLCAAFSFEIGLESSIQKISTSAPLKQMTDISDTYCLR